MIAIDTNILVRLLTRDDEPQYRAAFTLFDNEAAIYIPDSVILETEWVLRFAYDFSRYQICNALRGICGLEKVTLDDPAGIARVIDWHEAGLDLADALHLSKSETAGQLKTFDQAFAKKSAGLCCCEVSCP